MELYSDNLKHEVQRLALETTGKTWDALVRNPQAPAWVRKIHWERLGEEFLTPAYMSWFLKQLDQNAWVFDLENRLKIHVASIKYTFEMRMKNLALAVGLGLCLLGNINAFTIWKSLYSDEQLRATFSGPYAEKATQLAEADAKQEKPKKETSSADAGKGSDGTQPLAQTTAGSGNGPDSTQAGGQIKSFQTSMRGFLTDVSFGVGKIWHPSKEDTRSPFGIFMYEFFGSLLTGILVSIGAPYWHDILQALSSLRPDKAKG